MNIKTMSDHELLKLCQQYGERALLWRRKFIGLLPEVKGCGSIFEFTAKLAGLSEEQTRKALNLEKSFEDKPLLKNLLLNGEVGINKLARITAVVTSGNQEFWATQVKILSKAALETLVRDQKSLEQNGLFETKNEDKSVPGHSNPQQNILDDNSHEALKFQRKRTQTHLFA